MQKTLEKMPTTKTLATKALRALALSAILVMGLVMGMGLIGCAANNEQVIRDGLTESLDEFKDPTSEPWQEMVDVQGGQLESVGIDPSELVSTWIDGFDYSIGAVTVTGDTATVELSITCKQLSPAITAATDALMADESIAELSSDEVTQKTGEAIMDALRAAQPETTAVTIECEKVGNLWTEGASAENAYMSAIVG
ncbi:MAG: hypothetical protein LBL86_05270 [Coriobacteriales bacterium]|jgi:hypothetical protein|nr:hypothetical protein [Coriobacteriales bacterium]